MSQVSLRSRVSLPHYNISDHLEHLLTPCRLLSTPAILSHAFCYSPFLISSVCAFSSNLDSNRMLVFVGYLPAFNPILFLVPCPLYLLDLELFLFSTFFFVFIYIIICFLSLFDYFFRFRFHPYIFAIFLPHPFLVFCFVWRSSLFSSLSFLSRV